MFRFKRGDSWSFITKANIKDQSGTLIPMDGWEIKSQLRTASGKVICTFTCAWVNTAEQTYSHQCLNTDRWPANEEAFLDIQFTNTSGFRISTPTKLVFIDGDITK